MRILFMGTPDFAAVSLKALMESNHEIVGVISQPDKPVGRHFELKPTPVKAQALSGNLPVYQPDSLKNEAILPLLKELNPQLIVVAAYGKILPEYILNYPKYGCINVHASLLPKLRGAAPINYAIIDGEEKTGVTIMYMEKGLDTGDMIDKVETKITDTDNVETLHDRLAVMGGELLLKVIEDLEKGKATRTPQNHDEHTYAHMIHKEDCKIDFYNKTAIEVDRFVRGMCPFPGAFMTVDDTNYKVYSVNVSDKNSAPGKILEANQKQGLVIACKEGAVEIIELLPQGKKRMTAKQYFAGHTLAEEFVK